MYTNFLLSGNSALTDFSSNALGKIVFFAFCLMTVVGFLLMGIDKAKAKKGAWRIKEATLFLVAALFGGVGTTLGMIIFRHKTKHWYFVVFMPLLAALNLIIVFYLLNNGVMPL